jgi:hypothetical protein
MHPSKANVEKDDGCSYTTDHNSDDCKEIYRYSIDHLLIIIGVSPVAISKSPSRCKKRATPRSIRISRSMSRYSLLLNHQAIAFTLSYVPGGIRPTYRAVSGSPSPDKLILLRRDDDHAAARGRGSGLPRASPTCARALMGWPCGCRRSSSAIRLAESIDTLQIIY